MTLALQVGTPAQEPLAVVHLAHPRTCMAAQCMVPAAAHVVFADDTHVHVNEVCVGHVLMLKAMQARCVYAPLDSLPHPAVIAQWVEDAAQRRAREAAARMAHAQQGMWTFTVNAAAGTSNTFIRFR